MHPLEDARRKIGRANEHTQVLQEEVRAYRSRRPYEFVGKFESETSEYVFRLHISEVPPIEFSLIIGDIVQNLRSALDHIAWQLVLASGETPGRHTGFPICKSGTDYRDMAPRALRGMSDSGKALVEWSQPFNVRPDDPELDELWLLNEIARIDRHRLLHTTATIVTGATVRPVVRADVGPDVSVSMPSREPLQDRAEFMRVRVTPTGPNPRMAMQGAASSLVVFADPPGIAGLRIDVVDGMRGRCESIFGDALTEVERLTESS